MRIHEGAILVAGAKHARADAPACRVEEPRGGAGGYEHLAGVEPRLVALGDDRQIGLEGSIARIEPEAAALVVRRTGGEHAHRDVLGAAAFDEPRGDLAESAVAAHRDHTGVGVGSQGISNRPDRLSARQRGEHVAGDAGAREPLHGAIDARRVGSALGRRIADEQVRRVAHGRALKASTNRSVAV